MASSLLQKLAQEDAERVTLLSIEKAELDQRNLIHQAYKEGYQEGYQKGYQEGYQKGYQKSTIRMLKNMAEQGMELSLMSTFTKLSIVQIEEILAQNHSER